MSTKKHHNGCSLQDSPLSLLFPNNHAKQKQRAIFLRKNKANLSLLRRHKIEDPSPQIEALRELLSCRCGCGRNNTSFEFAALLYMAQGVYGKQLPIYQGCRCTKFNDSVGAAQNSPSLIGEHVDLHYENPPDLFLLIKALLAAGFESFRLYPHHLHIQRDPNDPIPAFAWANYPPKHR